VPGAHLIVTTRFPCDSAQRYSREPDFGEWGHCLEIFGLDLRSPSRVEALCLHLLDTHPRLDFIINNACQTVRRPPEFYAHMIEGEKTALDIMPVQARRLLRVSEEPVGSLLHQSSWITQSAEQSQVPLLVEDLVRQKHLFPEGCLDQIIADAHIRKTFLCPRHMSHRGV
jgi:hypothetical protein